MKSRRENPIIPVLFTATCSGLFQDDSSRLTSRRENPVIPVPFTASSSGRRKGGEGRKIGEVREEITNESKKTPQKKS